MSKREKIPKPITGLYGIYSVEAIGGTSADFLSCHFRGRKITVLINSSGSAALAIISKSLTHAPIEIRS